MGLGMVVTVLDQRKMPNEEAPARGQVRMTGDQVQRIFGSAGSAVAAEAPDFGNMGGQFRKLSLLDMLPRDRQDLPPDDLRAVRTLERMCNQNEGRGAFSIRPLRLP